MRSQKRPLAAAALTALIAALPLAPAELGAQQERFEDVTDVLLVEIPVQVLDNGEPVRGLTADDFEVLDGRKKQRIVGFDVVDLTLSGPAGEVEMHPLDVPSAARRHLLFLFDLALSRPATVVRAREAAMELIDSSLHPSDLVAVGVYSVNQGAQLILGFTPDRRQVALAIETLGLPSLLQKASDPLELVVAGLGRGADDAGQSADSPGQRFGVDPAAEIQALLESMETRVARAEEKNRILALTGSLAELAKMMTSVDGRKHVVFLSEGFDSSVLLGTGVSTEEERAQMQEQAELAASGQFWEVDSQGRFGDTSALNQLEIMSQEFLRADCAVQAVDIGGLRAEGDVRPRRSGDDGLFLMADKTGGEHYRNFNDLGQAMQRMLDRTSVTYLLAIQPEEIGREGEFRRLKVRVKGAAKNAQVVHRPGYFTPKPLDQRAPLEERLRLADALLGGRDGGSITTSVLSAPFATGYGTAYVPVLIEIDGPSLAAGRASGTLPTEIYAYALDDTGSVRDFFTQSMALDLAKVGPALAQSGFKFWGHFELPAGDYMVRTLVRDGSSGATGVAGSRVRVPAEEGGAAELSVPLFPEPMGKWLLGREQDTGEGEFDYPFMLDGEPFIPAARPVVYPGQPQRVSLVGYHLGDGALDLSCRLLDYQGRPVEGVEIDLEAREPGSVAGQERLVAYFAPGNPKPGPYTLEVTVSDAASGTRRTSSIPVLVEG